MRLCENLLPQPMTQHKKAILIESRLQEIGCSKRRRKARAHMCGKIMFYCEKFIKLPAKTSKQRKTFQLIDQVIKIWIAREKEMILYCARLFIFYLNLGYYYYSVPAAITDDIPLPLRQICAL